jgi:hypothetical protein
VLAVSTFLDSRIPQNLYCAQTVDQTCLQHAPGTLWLVDLGWHPHATSCQASERHLPCGCLIQFYDSMCLQQVYVVNNTEYRVRRSVEACGLASGHLLSSSPLPICGNQSSFNRHGDTSVPVACALLSLRCSSITDVICILTSHKVQQENATTFCQMCIVNMPAIA